MITSVDPGSRVTGVAKFSGVPNDPPEVTTLASPTVFAVQRTLEGSTRLLIEEQYLPRDPKHINWPSLQKLLLAAHRWIVCAELLDIPVVVIKPAEWQGPMFRTVPKSKDGKKLNTKQRSKLVVQSAWGEVTGPGGVVVPTSKITNDGADATCMGRWWLLFGSKRA